MMLINLKRVIRSGWLSFRRDGGLVVATVLIMVIPIASITSLFLLKDVSQFLISSFQDKVDISVYFKEEASESDILNIQKELSQFPEVKSVEYVSREMALENFIQKHQDDPVLMESVEVIPDWKPLASLNIKAFQASQYEAVANFLEKPDFEDFIKDVDYYQRKAVIERIFLISSTAYKVGVGLSLILAMIAVLVAFNTMRLAIYNSKEEIKVQRLVGASNWFIRGPFLVQGAIAGTFAALISVIILSLLCWFSSPALETLSPGFNFWAYFISNFFILTLIQFAIGIGLGVISSLIAIRKYLKV